MNLAALPAFADNYLWLLHDGSQAVAVDPGDAAPVLAALERWSLRLAAILVTHHHADHVGGIEALLAAQPAPVYGPADTRIPCLTHPIGDADQLDLLGWRFDVLHVPGHTASHLAYYTQPPSQAPLLFCGDTLFSGGCGRLFEGSPAQMHTSLTRLAALPADTQVCCAHEYTLANLRFARAVEPDNTELATFEAECLALRQAKQPTLPARLGRERQINPFLRCEVEAVIDAARHQGASSTDPVAVFAALRQWKNEFR
ncbi:MAG: hydroxyacylglutathione hydrolase [Leptothrix sp. (in: b-proteobacteria)]